MLKYLLLFFTIIMLSSTCDKVSSRSEGSNEICDEIVDAAQKYWVTNKDSIHSPNYMHYCDFKFINTYKEAFKANTNCSKNRTISGIIQVFGEPDKITPGVGGVFRIIGQKYHTYLENDSNYETVLYECVTNKERIGSSGRIVYLTQKYHFLIEKETGKHVVTIPIKGLTKY